MQIIIAAALFFASWWPWSASDENLCQVCVARFTADAMQTLRDAGLQPGAPESSHVVVAPGNGKTTTIFRCAAGREWTRP